MQRIRKQHGILHQEKLCHPHSIPGYLRPHQVAQMLQIKPYWIYDRIRNGTIKIEKNAEHGAYLFPDQSATLKQLKRLIRGEVTMLAF